MCFLDPASGTSVDYAYDSGIKYSYILELRPDATWPGFLLSQRQVVPTASEVWRGIQVMLNQIKSKEASIKPTR